MSDGGVCILVQTQRELMIVSMIWASGLDEAYFDHVAVVFSGSINVLPFDRCLR